MAIQTYKRRYAMLLLLCLCTFVNNIQYLQFTSIANVVTYYYRVSNVEVSLTSLVFSASTAIFMYPTTYLIETHGLRFTIILGTFTTAFGAAFKCMTIERRMFWLTLLGQSITAVGLTLKSLSSPRFVSVWFKSDETATTLGIMAVSGSLSSAVAFLFPSFLFDQTINERDIEYKLSILCIAIAALTALLFIAIVLFLEEKPKRPPTLAEAQRSQSITEKPSVSVLLRNRNYFLIGTSLIMNYKLGIILTVLLNQMILSVFKDGVYLVTACGLANVFSGILGVIILPIFLDKFKKFKLILVSSYCLIIIFFLLVFACLWYENPLLLLLSVFLAGLFHSGFSTIGVDTLLELTYPYPESKAYGYVMFVSCIISCILTPLLSTFIETIGLFYAFLVLVVMLIIGLLCLNLVEWDLKRVTAEKQPLLAKADALNEQCDL